MLLGVGSEEIRADTEEDYGGRKGRKKEREVRNESRAPEKNEVPKAKMRKRGSDVMRAKLPFH